MEKDLIQLSVSKEDKLKVIIFLNLVLESLRKEVDEEFLLQVQEVGSLISFFVPHDSVIDEDGLIFLPDTLGAIFDTCTIYAWSRPHIESNVDVDVVLDIREKVYNHWQYTG